LPGLFGRLTLNVGKSYRLSEFLFWTRREIYVLLALGIIPTGLYQLAHWRWLAIPWTVVALTGTATAFIVSFRNTQTYNRTVEAQQVWTSILNISRTWALMSRDFLNHRETTRSLVLRHLGWMTALRYEMRHPRAWENVNRRASSEYQAFYCVPEKDSPFEAELAKYVDADELREVLAAPNRATQLLGNQSDAIRRLFNSGDIPINMFLEMGKTIKELLDQQGRSERIKNFPYPRQYAVISTIFIRSFCVLLPFAMLKEFDALNATVTGVMKGHMVWLVIPFSVLISWMYTSLEQVGTSTENPFEGGANDVPVAQISRQAEIEMRSLIGDTDLPPLLQPRNNIIL
jgi:ion channel-forming bestrophin family protein